MAATTLTAPRRLAQLRPVTEPEGRSRGLLTLLVVGVVGALLAAVAGLKLALPLVLHPGQQAALHELVAPDAPGVGIGTGIRTSFGGLTVAEAQVNNGLSSADLGGMTHGVSSMVGTGKAQVNVVVTLWNSGSTPVRMTSGQFRLLTGRTTPAGAALNAAGTTLPSGAVPAGASVDARFTFVTPTNGSKLWLQFADAGRRTPMLVPLGSTAKIAATPEGHTHH